MSKIPSKVSSRLSNGLKRFQPILSSARARDLNESDTATIVTDFLAEVLGYDKYSEITSEHCIRGTYCDLAITIEGKLAMLIEIKAAGLDLKDNHIRQATDYAANQGLEWVILTNGSVWKIFKVIFSKPIEREEFVELNLLELNVRNSGDMERLFLLAKEGFSKSALSEFYTQVQALNRQTIAAVVLSEPVLKTLRRELDRLTPEVRVQLEDVEKMVRQEVLKRDLVEGKDAEEAIRKIHKQLDKAESLRKKTVRANQGESPAVIAAGAEVSLG